MSVMKEVPQYCCWTQQLNADMASHARRTAGKSFWSDHPEHWRYRDLEDLICDRKVVRMNDLCDSCHSRVLAWEREFYASRKAKRATT